jgi:hypothetical protein
MMGARSAVGICSLPSVPMRMRQLRSQSLALRSQVTDRNGYAFYYE